LIILRKKYILAITLGIMLVLGGFFNYKNQPIDVSTDIVDNSADAAYVVNMKEKIESIDPDNSQIADAYFVSARLEKEDTYNKQVKYQEEILYNEKSSDNIKKVAQEQVNIIVDKMSKEMAIEKLLEAKGFDEILAIINDDNVNIVVKTSEELTISQVAQIQSVVMREANAKAENIHVITKK